MQFPVFVAILPVLAALTHALAVPETFRLSAREAITVKACKDNNLQGGCKAWAVTIQTQCVRLGNTPWDGIISSVSIPNGYRCRYWDSDSCNGNSTPDIYAPGANSVPSNMNDRITSFKCYKN